MGKTLRELFLSSDHFTDTGKVETTYSKIPQNDAAAIDALQQSDFKTKKNIHDAQGRTAEAMYDIHNSKAHRNYAASPLINLIGFPIQQLARNALSSTGKETRLEEELTGLRILRIPSIPILYGTDIIRLTTLTTSMKDDMVAGKSGGGKAGILSGAISSIKAGIGNLQSKLGFPEDVIPSRLVLKTPVGFPTFKQEPAYDYYEFLPRVKNDAAGTLLGKFLKQNAQGTPGQMVNQVVGGAISALKGAINTALMGKPKTVTLPYPGIRSAYTYIGRWPTDGGGSTFQADYRIMYPNYTGKGVSHLKYADNNDDTGGLKSQYTSTIFTADAIAGRNDLSTLLNLYYDTHLPNPNTIETGRIWQNRKTKEFARQYTSDATPGGGYQESGNAYSKIDANAKSPVNIDSIGSPASTYGGIFDKDVDKFGITEVGGLPIGDSVDISNDFIPLIFKSVYKGKAVQFRATITGFSETYSPSWDNAQFIGSPFKYYTYDSIERAITFDFKVFSRNASEHMNEWDRLHFLASLVYPQGYSAASALQPPIIQLTLGDMYIKKYGFIENLSYTFDDTTPWEIGLLDNKDENYSWNSYDNTPLYNAYNSAVENYKAPKIINVAITFKFLQNRSSTGNLYGFNSNKPWTVTDAVPIHSKVQTLKRAGTGFHNL